MDHVKTSDFGMNDSGTGSESDTPLTHGCSPDVPGRLVTKMIFTRARIGADTPHGHAISNTIEILENMRTYVRPDWATHETQTLNWRLAWQADHMAGASPTSKGDR